MSRAWSAATTWKLLSTQYCVTNIETLQSMDTCSKCIKLPSSDSHVEGSMYAGWRWLKPVSPCASLYHKNGPVPQSVLPTTCSVKHLLLTFEAVNVVLAFNKRRCSAGTSMSLRSTSYFFNMEGYLRGHFLGQVRFFYGTVSLQVIASEPDRS
jgi:hypothetical protein